MYSLEERVFFVKLYYSTKKILKEVLRLYGEQFNVPHHKWPSKSVIIHTVKKFETIGNIHDDKAGKVETKRIVRSEENIDQARKIMHVMHQTSIPRVTQEIGISVASAHRILLMGDISLFPYKIQAHQAVSQIAVGKHLNFAMEFGVYLNAHPLVFPLTWFTDEAHFWLEGYVNKHNCRIWASSNPGVFLTKNLHTKKITVWATLSAQGLHWSDFFREKC